MSWQQWVDSMTKQDCVKAGIFGLGGESWHDPTQPGSINPVAGEISNAISKIKAQGFGSVSIGGELFSEILTVPGESCLMKSKSTDKDKKYLCYVAFGKSFVVIAMKGGADERAVLGVVEKTKDLLNEVL